MARTTGPTSLQRPEARGFSRLLGVLLGFLLVLCLYLLAQHLLGGGNSVPDPTPDPGVGETPPTGNAPGAGSATGVRTPVPGGEHQRDPGAIAPTGYRLLCLDAQTGQRLEGLRAFDLEARRDLGASNHEGLLVLPRIPARRILLYGDGFFYRMLVHQVGSSVEPGQKIQEIEVYRDRYTLSLLLRTQFEGAVSTASNLQLMVRRSDGKPMDGASFPTALFGKNRRLEPRLRKAWLQHGILATMDPEMVLIMQAAPAWVLGEPLRPLLLPLRGGRLRFSEMGRYSIRAWTSDGQVAQAEVFLNARQRAGVDLQFRAGKGLDLLLHDPAGKPVSNASVYLFLDRDGEDTELRKGSSSKSGEVAFLGLFGDEKIRIRVEATGYEVFDRQLSQGKTKQVLQLKALATRYWRFAVSEKGSGKVLPGVRVSLRSEKGGIAVTRETDQEGRVEVKLAVGETFRLKLEKKGFVGYAEMIGGSSSQGLPTRCEMIPGSIERQAKIGLICLLEGRALAARNGLASLVVKDPGLLAPGAMNMRRFLAGNRPERNLRAKVDESGRFRIWTDQKGEATLILFSDSGKQVKDILLVRGKVLHPKF